MFFFVSRLKDNAKEALIEEYDLDQAMPNEVLKDAKISLKYKENRENKQVELRLVTYFDNVKNRRFYFLPNLFNLKSEQIAVLYNMRWQLELLFKKNKTELPASKLLW